MKTCKTCVYNICPAPTQCKSCDKNTFSNYVFKSNCFGNYDLKITDCQRQDNTTCIECKYRKQIAELQEDIKNKSKVIIDLENKVSRRNLQIKDLKANQCPWGIVKDCKREAK
jgi:hypothetical protein